MVVLMTDAELASCARMVSALKPRAPASVRHQLMSPHHPTTCACAAELAACSHLHCPSCACRCRPADAAEASARPNRADERHSWSPGSRQGVSVCSCVRAPRPRQWVQKGLWRLVVTAEGVYSTLGILRRPRPLICGRAGGRGSRGRVRNVGIYTITHYRDPSGHLGLDPA